MIIEQHNLDGQGFKRCHVYPMSIVSENDYWSSVTNVPCPTSQVVTTKIDGIKHIIKMPCGGDIRWHEAGYVPGYRMCDNCKRHFIAKGGVSEPKLVRVGTRRG